MGMMFPFLYLCIAFWRTMDMKRLFETYIFVLVLLAVTGAIYMVFKDSNGNIVNSQNEMLQMLQMLQHV